MYPTLLDTKTGKTIVATRWDYSLFWWADGNGSCDCNRAMVMGEAVDDELFEEFDNGACYGCRRILVVDMHGDLEGFTKAEILSWVNDEYPQDLVTLYLGAKENQND